MTTNTRREPKGSYRLDPSTADIQLSDNAELRRAFEDLLDDELAVYYDRFATATSEDYARCIATGEPGYDPHEIAQMILTDIIAKRDPAPPRAAETAGEETTSKATGLDDDDWTWKVSRRFRSVSVTIESENSEKLAVYSERIVDVLQSEYHLSLLGEIEEQVLRKERDQWEQWAHERRREVERQARQIEIMSKAAQQRGKEAIALGKEREELRDQLRVVREALTSITWVREGDLESVNMDIRNIARAALQNLGPASAGVIEREDTSGIDGRWFLGDVYTASLGKLGYQKTFVVAGVNVSDADTERARDCVRAALLDDGDTQLRERLASARGRLTRTRNRLGSAWARASETVNYMVAYSILIEAAHDALHELDAALESLTPKALAAIALEATGQGGEV